MNKKYTALVGIMILVVGFVGGLGFGMYISKADSSNVSVGNDELTLSMLKFSDLQAHYPENPEACLAVSDDPSLKLDAADQTNITDSVMSAIIDIPAGTNVDVHLKTYDKTNATGTSLYESTYGTYNFAVKKDKTNNWVVTRFVACKKAQ